MCRCAIHQVLTPGCLMYWMSGGNLKTCRSRKVRKACGGLFFSPQRSVETSPSLLHTSTTCQDITSICKVFHVGICRSRVDVYLHHAPNALHPINRWLLMPISAELTNCTSVHASWLMSTTMKTSESIILSSNECKYECFFYISSNY
jgi:hypothetical protein